MQNSITGFSEALVHNAAHIVWLHTRDVYDEPGQPRRAELPLPSTPGSQRVLGPRLHLAELSLSQLADHLQCSHNNVWNAENGRVDVAWPNMVRTAKVLGVSIDYLAGLTDDPRWPLPLPDNGTTFGQRLKAARQHNGLTSRNCPSG